MAVRAERALRHPDFFEDGDHHWWIAATLAAVGSYHDPFAHQTLGIWLPGYDVFAAGILRVAGLHAADALRFANVALAGASVLLVARLADRERPGAGVPAAFLFALFPYDVLTSAMSVPEPLAVLLVLVAADLLLAPRAPAWRVAGAAALALACLVRYEAWLAALALGSVLWRREGAKAASWIAPALAVMLAWAALTLAGPGFFGARIYRQTHGELIYHVGTGFAFGNPLARLWAFVVLYAPAVLLVLALAAAGARDAKASRALALAPVAALGAMILLGVTSGSVRYLALAAPFLCVMAGAGALRLRDAVAGRAGVRVAAGGVVALVVVQGLAGAAEALYVDQFGDLHAPKLRAGEWIAQHPPREGRLVVSESPTAARASGVEPARLVGSKDLPEGRDAALAFLQERADYVVFVDNAAEKFPFYRLGALFPELREARDTPDFALAFDANGWEREYGAQEVLVYRVRSRF